MAKRFTKRRIEVGVRSRDFAEGVWTALGRLGYRLERLRPGARAPDARIVADRRLGQLGADATAPVILVDGWRSRHRDDPRVIGIVEPPARLLDLYALLQEALEPNPRAAPRVSTVLPASSLRDVTDSPGAIVSLSERGCLLRSASVPPGDESLRLRFALPNGGLIYTWAQPRYRVGNETGLAFEALSDEFRSSISEFVMQSLTQSRL